MFWNKTLQFSRELGKPIFKIVFNLSWSQVLDHADSSESYEKLILDSKYAEPNWEDIFAEETN